jgi:hypothetical protein
LRARKQRSERKAYPFLRRNEGASFCGGSRLLARDTCPLTPPAPTRQRLPLRSLR